MNLLMLALIGPKQLGVRNKIEYQFEALKKIDSSIKLCELVEKEGENYFCLENKKILKVMYGHSVIGRIGYKISIYILIYKLKLEILEKNIDSIYIRYIQTTPYFLSFYKFLKNNKIKIILEIPTYPYDAEFKKDNIFRKMDRKYRLELYKYVDKIVTYSDDKEIWGIPCINISNGIDLESVKLVKRKEKKEKQIVFTSVSNCSYWHGIDRFISSLVEYKKSGGKERIIFNIVGEGTETVNLKKIVKDNPIIKDIVIFHGFKLGKDLEEVYNKTDIAVGSLGRHRSGITNLKSLKNREYSAKGLPMIYSENDSDLDGKEFVHKLIANDELIDLKQLICWYKNLKISPEEIREYANIFSWDIQMKKVLKEIK